MPNVNRQLSPWIGNGNPDTFQEPTSATPGGFLPYAPGDLGVAYDYYDKAYQKVRLDSGATAATATGVVAANQLAFWKDRANYIVTNDATQALFGTAANSFRNNVAGVFRAAVTAGYNCFILQRGRNINLKEAGSATAGMMLEANSGTSADALGVAVGTNVSYQQIGIVVTATAANVCVADFDIPNIP